MKAENVIGPVRIESKPRRSYLGIRIETPFAGMFGLVSKELRDLRRCIGENKLSADGPYFLRYYHCDMKSIMEVEVGFMTKAIISDNAKLRIGSLPEGEYATLTYRGNGLRANQAMMKWARDNQISFEPIVAGLAESYACRYEAYLTDYRVEPRKLLWDVELSLKIRGK